MTSPLPAYRSARRITVMTDRFDGAGPMDTGVSHALALAVGAGELGETLRIHPTDRVVAFGRQDTLDDGYHEAVRRAQTLGYQTTQRLAGGRAAVFHTGTLAFSWAIPTLEPRAGVHSRFEEISGLMADCFRELGADARVGEVEGEYCPGAYSVNVAGRMKVMGVGQRLVRGAAHVGGVVVVSRSAELRSVLQPVYGALGLDWVPETAGALEDVLPGIGLEDVRNALLRQFEQRAEVAAGRIPGEVVETGRRLAPTHTSQAP